MLPHSRFVNSVSYIKKDIKEMSLLTFKLLLIFVAQYAKKKTRKIFDKMQKPLSRRQATEKELINWRRKFRARQVRRVYSSTTEQ